jgi:GTP-binding protein EngB required for normal cell division
MSTETEQLDPARVDPDSLVDRTEALTRFVIATDGILPADRLTGAREVAMRAGDRLRLSGAHTVVALAGATGSGKSTLFNALAGMELSQVGLRRPTTEHAFACVWGPMGAAPLLDWLGIATQRRFTRESVLDAQDQARLRGLVLLDLPDFDSRAAEHRVEADRLLAMVDLVVWVTDPQKYADQVLHDRYLRAFHQHRDVMVVVLNQADRLGSVDAQRCVADLRKLLGADGLPTVPVFAVSARAADPGIGQLRETLEYAVATRAAALYRLAADLDEVSGELAGLSGPAVGPELVSADRVALLADGLGAAAGVPALTEAAEQAYRQRAARARWLWRAPAHDPVDEVLDAQPAVGQEGAISLAVRDFTEPLTAGLPVPWADAVTEAARARLPELPGALRDTVSDTEFELGTPRWVGLVGLLRWLSLFAVLGGLGLLGMQLWHRAQITVTDRGVLLAAAGALAWLLLTVLALALLPVGARTARAYADERLRHAVTALTREYVAAPARDVLIRYTQARDALTAVHR